ncbi:MAG: hypothetical protein ABDH49_01810 [Candidatus Hydrothermales bacterium]
MKVKVSQILFLLAVITFIIAIVLKLSGGEFPHLFKPYTYIKGTWTLLLFSLTYHLIFEKEK